MPRGIDLSKFRGDSDSDEDAFPPPKKQIVLDSFKQQTFSHGIQKKTKKELEKEEEERKRKQEELDAAKAYKEFEDFFAGEDAASAPRGGTRAGPATSGGRAGFSGGFVKAGGGSEGPSQAYVPTRAIPTGPSNSSSRRPRSPSPPRGAKPKGKRAMDSFLEEIKKEQEYRQEKFGRVARAEGSSVSAMAAWEKNRGSHDIGDSETTNLYISNLPQGISEDSLGNFFAKIGPVGAVKIMWPRGDEDTSIGAGITSSRRAKAGLSGFVAYMKRRDAEIAVKELDGLDWGGSILRVGWSKMVRIPPKALYDVTSGKDDDRRRSRSPRRRKRTPSRSRSPSRERERDRGRYDDRSRGTGGGRGRATSPSRTPPRRRAGSRDRARGRSPSPARERRAARSPSSGSSRSRSPPPQRKTRSDVILEKLGRRMGSEKEKFVKHVADRVKKFGYDFEDMLRDRERDNEKFAFLRNSDLPEYHLYRFCLDSRYRLPTPGPDDFEDEGKAELYSSDSAEDSEREHTHRTNKGHLGKMARRRLEAGLRAMTGEREQIARLMEFAMNHADAVDEVADVICQSLQIESTAVPRKLARLYLISDILHNSAASLPNVWRYRNAFEGRLPDVMEHMADVHRSLVAHSGKISGETFKSQVAFVIEIWENWIVFTSDITDTLRRVLDGASAHPVKDATERRAQETSTVNEPQSSKALDSSRFKKAGAGGFKSTFVTSVMPVPSAEATPVPAANDEDLDGEAMDQDLDGEAMDEDLDGEAMQDDEDLDGEAMS